MATIGKTNKNGYTYVRCEGEKDYQGFLYDGNGGFKPNIEDYYFSGHGYNIYVKFKNI